MTQWFGPSGTGVLVGEGQDCAARGGGGLDVRSGRDLLLRIESEGRHVDSQRAKPLSRAERIGLVLHRGADRWLAPLGIWVMRRTRGGIARLWHVDALLLTTRGRRSGRERTVVLQYFPDGDAMIVIAANDGGRSHPGWCFNLAAEPSARVEVMGRTIPVRAEELREGDAAHWWARIVRHDPNYGRYARATDRRFPIMRLVPTRGPAPAVDDAAAS